MSQIIVKMPRNTKLRNEIRQNVGIALKYHGSHVLTTLAMATALGNARKQLRADWVECKRVWFWEAVDAKDSQSSIR